MSDSPDSRPGSRGLIVRRVVLAVALAALAVAAVMALTGTLGGGDYGGGRLPEPSGLAAGSAPSVYWTHNDSGDGPTIYAVTVDGRLLGAFRLLGADAKDWEAIASDGAGRLYVGDIGNNANARRDLTVYRIAEPSVSPDAQTIVEGEVPVERAIRFHYPEQTAFPPRARNFDAEALFWDARARALYLLTKHRGDMATVLYRFDDLESTASTPLSARGRFVVGGDPDNYGGMVTGAELSPDGRFLAVLTYHALFIFERPAEGDDWLGELRNRIDFDQSATIQAEAVAWHDGAVVFTNEQGGVFRIDDPLTPREGDFP